MNFLEIKKELWELSDSSVFRMSKIKDWISNYSDLYKTTYDFVYSQHLYTDIDGSTIKLPPCAAPTDEEIFLNLYESLNTILNFHVNETYFEHEMREYNKIKNSPSEIKTWIAKNEDIGVKEYVCFIIDYLDYDKEGYEGNLSIYIHNLKEPLIFIDRQDFMNTIAFLEIFNELYWVQEFLIHN